MNTKGYVYLIGAESEPKHFKIGYSKDPDVRLKRIQTSYPEKLKLYAKIKGTQLNEQQIHQRFANFRSLNEWFVYSPDILKFFQVKERPKRKVCEKELFRFSASIYNQMRVNGVMFAPVENILSQLDYEYIPEFIEKIEIATKYNVMYSKMKHENISFLMNEEIPKFRGEKEFFILSRGL